MKLALRWACLVALVFQFSADAAWAQKDIIADGKVEIRREQQYAGNTNERQAMDVFLPVKRNSDKPLPIIVYIHGGGWINGSKASYGKAAVAQAESGNYAAASINYRLSNEAKWPAQIHDCKAAIRWLKGHAKELNIDPDKIAVQGSSAGGHLVTLLGLTAGVKELEGEIGEFTSLPSSVTCVVNYCGPSMLYRPLMAGEAAEQKDDPAVFGLIGGGLQDKLDVARQASPLTYVTAKAAPVMTVHGTKDLRVRYEQATALDEALKNAGASSLLVPVTDGGHGINGGPELTKRVQQFIDLHLRGVKADISSEPIQAVVVTK